MAMETCASERNKCLDSSEIPTIPLWDGDDKDRTAPRPKLLPRFPQQPPAKKLPGILLLEIFNL